MHNKTLNGNDQFTLRNNFGLEKIKGDGIFKLLGPVRLNKLKIEESDDPSNDFDEDNDDVAIIPMGCISKSGGKDKV